MSFDILGNTSPQQAFNATTVPLEGSNLIEASAGTGKTYSIAIMVLRLVLQHNLPLREILMVTFTKAAVAELEERIRLFIRSACKASQGKTIKDDTITALVDEAMGHDAAQQALIRRRLEDAVLFLDETSVLTIHSFCQLALSEFAFETGQVFRAQTLENTSVLLQQEVDRFWRREIAVLPTSLLQLLIEAGFSRERVMGVVKEHLGGKEFIHYGTYTEPSYCKDDHDQWLAELCGDDGQHKELLERAKELEITAAALKGSILEEIGSRKEEIGAACLTNDNAQKAFLPLLHDAESFFKEVVKKKTTQYTKKLFPWLLDRIAQWENETAAIKQLVQTVEAGKSNKEERVITIINRLYCIAIRQAAEGISRHKLRNNLLAFDDMIVNLHRALMGNNSELLAAGLRKRYKAVFIDEFQDTDRLQYEIFDKAFGTGTILFYIGDPKQSIYAWRKADIQTYFKARRAVRTVYGMNHNYRSAAPFIAAMNHFFAIDDPFYFSGEQDAIEYIDVDTPANSDKGNFLHSGGPEVPITITRLEDKEQAHEALAAQVAQLLDGQTFSIEKGGQARRVQPADIGILVRSHAEADSIKQCLARYGVQAVTIGDAKVLESEEAVYLWYLLQAMESPSQKTIDRALLSPFTGYTSTELLLCDTDRCLELFQRYKNIWERDGVYTALMQFVSDFGVRHHLLERHTENGERIITNLYQLIELVHKVQAQKSLSPLELTGWLKRGIDGMETEGDEYLQRVESDEEAVKIVTIHKSKGLEYRIVLTASLDLGGDNNLIRTCSFRDPQSGKYVSLEKKYRTDQQKRWQEVQNEQENRRLLYVALTRAVYKCFIYKIDSNRKQHSTLSTFLKEWKNTDPSLICETDAVVLPPGFKVPVKTDVSQLTEPLRATGFALAQQAWRRVSYTSLAAKGEHKAKPVAGPCGEDYDRFVFEELPRGVQTGNLLHYLFEHLPFGDKGKWPVVMERALVRYAPENPDRYRELLPCLLEQVLETEIALGDCTFTMANVAAGACIHEFEFDCNVPALDARAFNSLSNDAITIAVKPQDRLEGLLNGKMDLFFCCGDKYYILDWKSNYLGSQVEDYNGEGLAAAMNDNNYHLQYLLYTVAACRYLHSRLGSGFDYERDFGGVVYLFVRGMRKGSTNGIFTARPTAAQVAQLEELLGCGAGV